MAADERATEWVSEKLKEKKEKTIKTADTYRYCISTARHIIVSPFHEMAYFLHLNYGFHDLIAIPLNPIQLFYIRHKNVRTIHAIAMPDAYVLRNIAGAIICAGFMHIFAMDSNYSID